MPADDPKRKPQANITAMALWAAAGAAIAGFAGVYVMLARPATVLPAPAQVEAPLTKAAPSGPGTNALSQGQMAAFVFKKEPEVLPEVHFQDASGNELTLADWRGKTVLLNLWATWCAPCRKEMPTLDRLQQEMGSSKFEVVAVSVDRKGLAASEQFLKEVKAEGLKAYADPTARLSATLRAVGLPATLLLDPKGREVGRLLGPAEWDSEDAKRLIRSVIK
ncbi:MAG TPA: TlpA disulfide reductase family protein [Hyphomicrobiaceae bacterium]|jgi:thiol-disulfide isomerase/thioredoxin|nr:TlpA disulfide reductase family protein [Hyphomicrobiaceae bacterium]